MSKDSTKDLETTQVYSDDKSAGGGRVEVRGSLVCTRSPLASSRHVPPCPFPAPQTTAKPYPSTRQGACVICSNAYIGVGHSAQPLSDGRCCDDCSLKVIEQRARHLVDCAFTGDLPPPIVKEIVWAVPVPAFPADALLQLKQRNKERKLAAAAVMAKLEEATSAHHLLTPPVVGKKRAAEGVGVVDDQPTKMAKTYASGDIVGMGVRGAVLELF